MILVVFELVPCVFGLDVRHDFQRAVFSLRVLSRCQARLFQRAVFNLRVWVRCQEWLCEHSVYRKELISVNKKNGFPKGSPLVVFEEGLGFKDKLRDSQQFANDSKKRSVPSPYSLAAFQS